MILADTSVWIDHLRRGDSALAGLLDTQSILTHPLVVGELALGFLRQRAVVLGALRSLPQAITAKDDEVFGFIESRALFGQGIGYMDAHLLASVTLTPGTLLWTRERQLRAVAKRLGFHAELV
jgi:predicted nucleic acid-binding protein